MNYTKLFPSHTTVDSTDSSRVNGEGGGGEEGVREGKGEREDGARSGGVAAGGEEDKKKLMKKQGFVNYTEGEFFERSVSRVYVCMYVRVIIHMYVCMYVHVCMYACMYVCMYV